MASLPFDEDDLPSKYVVNALEIRKVKSTMATSLGYMIRKADCARETEGEAPTRTARRHRRSSVPIQWGRRAKGYGPASILPAAVRGGALRCERRIAEGLSVTD